LGYKDRGHDKLSLSIDPLIQSLLSSANKEALSTRLANMFEKLDSDRSGALSFQELRYRMLHVGCGLQSVGAPRAGRRA
jgi:Ca2+-binding EF-hand superfamily protein